jgi:hypothetical protein
MLLTAVRPDQSLEYAGWRVIPHAFVPRSWGLPFNLGVLAEFSFERPVYHSTSKSINSYPEETGGSMTG